MNIGISNSRLPSLRLLRELRGLASSILPSADDTIKLSNLWLRCSLKYDECLPYGCCTTATISISRMLAITLMLSELLKNFRKNSHITVILGDTPRRLSYDTQSLLMNMELSLLSVAFIVVIDEIIAPKLRIFF